ncbi:MAG: T9SS type A sorting domain-containing protein [Ignavibacteria bacterium]|nr:T9SS type A sorting domain-containing protein [Ignavibacteria bacterium]
MHKYKVYKKVTEEWGFQYLAETTDTFFVDNTEQCITGPLIANERVASYRVTAVDNTSKESVPSDAASTRVYGPPMEKALSQNKVLSYQLYQNNPNPFNPTTKIRFSISDFGLTNLKVFDLLGREVAVLVNEPKQPGEYEVEFNASKYELSSGVYFYQLVVNGVNQLTSGLFISTKKLLLTK